jgi:hypothetical protein
MADPKSALEQLIEEHGGRLVREEKHKVFKFPNGEVFTTAKTPECPRSYRNAKSLLMTLLNLHPPDRGTPGERREKRVKRKPLAGSKMLPYANHVRQHEWKETLEAVKPVLPERPSAKQRPMSSAKIIRRAQPLPPPPPPVTRRQPKIIQHPVHGSRPQSSARPPVVLDRLLRKFGGAR